MEMRECGPNGDGSLTKGEPWFWLPKNTTKQQMKGYCGKTNKNLNWVKQRKNNIEPKT